MAAKVIVRDDAPREYLATVLTRVNAYIDHDLHTLAIREVGVMNDPIGVDSPSQDIKTVV